MAFPKNWQFCYLQGMRWMLIAGLLALVGCAEEESPAKMPNRVVLGGATGESGAALFDALHRTAQLGGGVIAEFHDEQGSFEISVVSPSENSPVIGCGYPAVEILFNAVAMSGESLSDQELRERIKALVEAAHLLGTGLILDVSAIESSSSADAVKYLRLFSKGGVRHFKLSGIYPAETAN